MGELYLYGEEETIKKIIKYCQKNNLIKKGKLKLIDLLPELKEVYVKKQGIVRVNKIW